jgi:hypothetical protein
VLVAARISTKSRSSAPTTMASARLTDQTTPEGRETPPIA